MGETHKDQGIPKLALVLSGAVSLGSYEAGVVYQLLQSMEHADYSIDLLAGASAGAMTSALAARCLMTGVPYQIMQEVWVEKAHIKNLKVKGKRKNQEPALLSGKYIENLIKEYLQNPPTDPPFKPRVAPENLTLVMTLTNLKGVPYAITPAQGISIPAVSYTEATTFRLRPGDKSPELWGKIGRVAQASGAFPGAFPPVVIDWEEGDREILENGSRLADGWTKGGPFYYSDGGILDNRPLGRALNALADTEATHSPPLYDPDRYVIMVEPTSLGTTETQPENREEDFDVLKTLILSGISLPRQALLYDDFLEMEKVNQRLQWLVDYLLQFIPRLQGERDITISGKARKDRGYDQLLTQLVEANRRMAGDAVKRRPIWEAGQGIRIAGRDEDSDAVLHHHLERLREFYESPTVQAATPFEKKLAELRSLYATLPAEAQNLVLHLHFNLENISGLLGKKKVKVDRISPKNAKEELAGEFLFHFGGFLDRRYMRDDFTVGRKHALEWLRQNLPGCRDLPEPADFPQNNSQNFTGANLTSLPLGAFIDLMEVSWRGVNLGMEAFIKRLPLSGANRMVGRFPRILAKGVLYLSGGAGMILAFPLTLAVSAAKATQKLLSFQGKWSKRA